MVTLLIGGWDGEWYMSNVSILTQSGRTCPGPSLPIWLADHFSLEHNGGILTCGGRSNEQQTLCWWWDMGQGNSQWNNAPRSGPPSPALLRGFL